MKVLIVTTSDLDGGAARAAYRLHRALLEQFVDSQMLVQNKLSDDFTVHGPITKHQKVGSILRPYLDRIPVRYYKHRTKTLFSAACVPLSDVVSKINAIQPDVVHLHWVNGGMMRVEDVARIRAPVVWSLHDMWPFTGGCHYDEGCGAFREKCGKCKVLQSKVEKDLSRRVHKRKKNTFQKKSDITVVGLSRWLAESAASSSLFSRRLVVNLPNPINTEVFAPYEQAAARKLLNLPLNKKLILFGAMGATSDPRKGFKELSNALQKLETEDVELVVIGASQPKEEAEFVQPAHYLGRLYDDVTLRLLYNAADVTIVPSLQENLSNSIMESLACGTPVVGFNIGGNADLVEHQHNGYLASPSDTKDLAKGIDWVLQYPLPSQLEDSARHKVMTDFEQSSVARRYIDLYTKILERE